ncbi:unnamed protein product [Medioppia subpectinata]|uniref:Protein-tyrosine-phosphatase n=1 Tax=Medioppia subpectinata TaxID=1979941 RepID=A0A7R9PTM7_9ACAR|nr:unnamed protein product [Medioppia subpectinata]CAG2100805.1 unnamed protein product [Medioppia subpectinata]
MEVNRTALQEVSEIEKNLLLGSYIVAEDMDQVKRLDIKHILSVDIVPLEDMDKHPDISYLFIQASDNPMQDLITRFEECYHFIDDGLKSGHKVLVHCVAGVSRSSTIVISYLMVKHRMSFEAAMALAKSKRSIVCPNDGFRKQLKLFETMNRQLDPMNGQFRQLLVEHLRYEMMRTRPWIRDFDAETSNGNICEPLSDYFKKWRELSAKHSSTQRREDVYKCKKCRIYLFNEINVIKGSISGDSQPLCESLYVEPLTWMTESISHQESGAINCQNCFTKLGYFHWNQIPCECNQHKNSNALSFKIDIKRVDSPLILVSFNT